MITMFYCSRCGDLHGSAAEVRSCAGPLNEVRFCPLCGADLDGNDPHQPDCPKDNA